MYGKVAAPVSLSYPDTERLGTGLGYKQIFEFGKRINSYTYKGIVKYTVEPPPPHLIINFPLLWS